MFFCKRLTKEAKFNDPVCPQVSVAHGMDQEKREARQQEALPGRQEPDETRDQDLQSASSKLDATNREYNSEKKVALVP
mgnify:CR=1 FL=1